jgi:hypothetical protein
MLLDAEVESMDRGGLEVEAGRSSIWSLVLVHSTGASPR